MIKFGSFTVLLLTLLFLLLICNLGFERDCINKMSVIWFPPNHPPVNINDCYCRCIPLFMKCAIGLLFDTFLPLHGEIVLLLFLYSHWLGPSFSLHSELHIFMSVSWWGGAGCLERSHLGGLYISRGHAFCTPTHTWERMHVHIIVRPLLTQRLIITASAQPDWKAHTLATIDSPMCSAVIKGKLKDDG